MKIAEFFAVITLKGGKETVQTMKSLVNSSIATKAALFGAAAALYKMSDVARKSAMFMDMYQVNTGLSIQQLQRLSFQAGVAGVSMQELGGAIQKLQQANARARLGYGWDPIFTRLGLHPGQDPVDQLNKMGAALRKLQATHPAEAHALAAQAGLSDSMYYALMKGTSEEMNKQLILTNKEQSAVVKLNQQWNKFWFYIKQITIKMQALSAGMQTGIVKMAIRAAQGVYELFKRISDAVAVSEKLQKVMIALGLTMAAVFAPEILIIGALLLLLEDLFTYFEGGDSVTGRLVEWVNQSKEFKELWEAIKDFGVQFYDLIKMALDGWKELIAVLKDAGVFEQIASWITSIVEGITTLLRLLNDAKGEGFAAQKSAWAQGGGWQGALQNAGPLGFALAGGVSVYNYFTSTGDTVKDGDIAARVQAEQMRAAQGQMPNRSLGNKQGGVNYK